MAFAETANLAVKLTLGGNFNSQLAKTRAGLKGFDKDASRAFKAGGQIGTGIKRSAYIAAGGIAFLASQVALGLDSLVKLESQTAQTNAVLKSTGGVAGVTAKQVRNLAEKYEAMNATIGDELIQNAENLLLTFTKVNKKAFEPALQAALDMNTALGKGPDGLSSTIQLVGKALQDPEKGLTRLGRAVGGFSDETVAAVKAALKQNDVLGAQSIILAELNRRYGGSFLAGGNTTAGKVAKFTDSIEDLQRALATALLPTIGKVADKLTKFLADPKVVAEVGKLGDAIASMFSEENLDEAGKVLGEVFDAAKAAAPVVLAAAKAMGSIVKTAVGVFKSLPPEIQALAVGAFAINKLTGGLVTNIAGAVFGALKAMTVTAGVVYVNGGIGGGLPGGGKVPPVGPPGGVALPAIGAGIAIEKLDYTRFHSAVAKALGPTNTAIRSVGTQFHAGKAKDDTVVARQIAILEGIAKRGREAGKELTQKQIMATFIRNQARQDQAAAAIRQKQQETTQRVKDADQSIDAGALRTASAARDAGRHSAAVIGGAIRASRPIMRQTVTVNVTAGSVTSAIHKQQSYGPANGSNGGNIGLNGPR